MRLGFHQLKAYLVDVEIFEYRSSLKDEVQKRGVLKRDI
jgi:hypothetical protein